MIFSFFKGKEKRVSSELKVDVHSHLIPGIDDGSQSMEESLALLKGMEVLGYKKIITTPHIMSDAYPNTPENINIGLKKLRYAAFNEGIKLQIEAAAEYYLDDSFYELLKKEDLLTLKDNYVLFETSYFSKPLQLEEMIFSMTSSGYIPVMAHPERYRYIKDPLAEYSRFQELGVVFQVNLNSFAGHYGRKARELAFFLSENGMISFLGSDIHHKKQVETLSNVFMLKEYKNILKNNKILNDTFI
ncbi:MAG: CpsB/CapC family capsule biosynthesis tyrosine phosphatase [Campylobacterota bacterium]|nr:CpsB/CapC family capsule biosynthesis tyrosine phosphatase [Campylobacterota bacterium]